MKFALFSAFSIICPLFFSTFRNEGVCVVKKSSPLLKKIALVSFFLISISIVSISIIFTSAKGKVSGYSSQLTDYIKERYNIDVNLSDISFSFLPLGVSFGRISASVSQQNLGELEECFVSEIEKLFLSEEKSLKIECKKAVFQLENITKTAVNSIKNSSETSEKQKNSAQKSKKSIRFQSDSLFVFRNFARKFRLNFNFSASGGKIFLEDSENPGSKIEFLFSKSLENGSLRIDGFDLSSYREIIQDLFNLDIRAGNVNAFSEIKKENRTFNLKNDITIKNLSFFHPLLDSEPFTLPLFRFNGNLIADQNEKSVSTEGSNISLGGINAIFSGSYSKGSKNFSIKTESAKLNKLETLIHNRLFENYLFGGELELFVQYSKTKEADSQPFFAVTGNLAEPKQLSERLDYLKTQFEYTFSDEDGKEKSFLVGEKNPWFTPVTQLPEHLIWAVVISEDAGFFLHKGIDFQELDAAVNDNIKKKTMRGGSTISQQLAKNLFLNREKTLLRKFREVLLAIEIDETLSKERILEIYFNIVEWGPNIFGIKHAAEYYFGKEPFELTPLESVYLASIIPGPKKYHYQFLTQKVSENWYKNLYRVLNIMVETGHLTYSDYWNAQDETIKFRQISEDLTL